ncbi:hypothetical protein CS542_03495 [Pedobacter sp. IW39]|nr:hypothetical protein CS542_03495 [Pedobacter sp. IW39]
MAMDSLFNPLSSRSLPQASNVAPVVRMSSTSRICRFLNLKPIDFKCIFYVFETVIPALLFVL